MEEYNHRRPNDALGKLPPVVYAKKMSHQGASPLMGRPLSSIKK